MTPRSRPSLAETDTERVIECLNLIRESVDHLAQKLDALEVIADELSRVRDELKFVMNESAALFRRFTQLPLDPTSIDWAARVAEIVPESDPTETAGTEPQNSPQGGMQDVRKAPGSAPAASKIDQVSTVVCDSCDREVTPEDARRDKWTDVARFKGGGSGAWSGVCNLCTAEPSRSEKPKVSKSLFPNS